MPLDLAFDSLGDDEFQCLLFVMPKPVGWWFFLLVYPSKHISSRHVRWSSLGVLDPGVPSPAHSPPFSPWRSSRPLPPAPPVPGRLTPPPLSPAGWGGGALPPGLQDLLSQLGPPADGCLPRRQDLPLCAQWQRQQHPRQRRRRRQPRPPQTLLFPGVKRAFPPFHLPRKRTIAGKSFALCTWEDIPRAKENSLPAASPSGIWTLERLRAAWGCQRGARRPGAGALRAGARPSCRSCCCCCARAPTGLRRLARRRHPSSICGRLVSGRESPSASHLHIWVHITKLLGFRRDPCASWWPGCAGILR